jgi:hypothetical protein
MSLEYRDVSAAGQRISSRLKRAATIHGLIPLSILAALSIAAEVDLLAHPIVRAHTATVPSTGFVPSSPAAARAADDRWQAARRVCHEMQEMQDRGRADTVRPYTLCLKEVLRTRMFDDSRL